MKKLISVIGIIVLLLLSGCDLGAEHKNIGEKSEFCLISETIVIELNMDISKVNKEPISVALGSGDGFDWAVNQYDDIEIKTLLSDDDKNIINRISTQSPNYETARGIRVGDGVAKLLDLHKEDLAHSKSPEAEYYLFDPEDDIGFKKIYFYIDKNDAIHTIVMEDGIDG